MLLLSLQNGWISEEEFLILYEANTSKNLPFPHGNYSRFELENIDEAECLREFRVRKSDVPCLKVALGLPDAFSCEQRSLAEGTEGLCIVLKRLAYPCRYSDMIHRFGRPVPEISMICNHVIDWIYDHHSHKITEWNFNILNPALLETYAAAVTQKGAALNNCFGFVDGTVNVSECFRNVSEMFQNVCECFRRQKA
ncbi:uncharacterized protein LOC116304769 [Actinia tenebrosa]|uniref:Uncharacterized protein LOC116304769 n=1 Tax=Actinia tenebrosa TaxID=6105 RepID=A0A6P8ITQ6_ACTTE|nr:uncharacterized protein LOC116304769 [Actinia tenebrosa]